MLKDLEECTYDVVIIGTGIAGMTAALSLDTGLSIALVSSGPLAESSSYKAQGGMAVAVGEDDSTAQHFADTLRVGQGLCRKPAANVLVQEGPAALTFLETFGVQFNGNQQRLSLTREAGHSCKRIAHYYDYTGRYIVENLAQAIVKRSKIDLISQTFLVEILTEEGRCCGCLLLHSGKFMVIRARAVVLATGGYSGLFERSTNSISANGDGIAAAYRAGAVIADMEFVQFHPTTFTTCSGQVFLLTEALRGEGAVLRNEAGERFMFNYHANGELAPRDEVSRAILSEINRQQQPVVYLDATKLGRSLLKEHFRQVYAELARNSYDMSTQVVPICPAAHYSIGGILTDLWGRSTVDYLYACGEVAATGVHGANRLASNSLLEGVVFGRRVAENINHNLPQELKGSLTIKAQEFRIPVRGDTKKLGRALNRAAGMVRNAEAMQELLDQISPSQFRSSKSSISIRDYHTGNAYALAQLMLEAALVRRESRGTHFREDYPHKDEGLQDKHVVQQWGRKAVLQ